MLLHHVDHWWRMVVNHVMSVYGHTMVQLATPFAAKTYLQATSSNDWTVDDAITHAKQVYSMYAEDIVINLCLHKPICVAALS